MWNTIEAVVKAGATIINVPDTVGYAVPEEFGELIRNIHDCLKNLNDKVLLSVHCHNDLGLATANTLIAVKNGADKVECTGRVNIKVTCGSDKIYSARASDTNIIKASALAFINGINNISLESINH
ncbi:Isopropylmalate/homocitrate/citramalate synthases-like protein [Desulforamulus reducens MI-1]|uniref:2-isopropylmalate synthase n=1 Tax=Desulforamulus reducens (strain ATCC BAA-1160 / DSM 100696 / MI-1) TaxID=349161 RepID=A4J5K5_DESRM|nr:Isopropylmalate/homocitrate/citramalate synthases-like protein [Desulforamulus reducens MI-1]